MKKKLHIILLGLSSLGVLALMLIMLKAAPKKPMLGKQKPKETTIVIKKEEPKKQRDDLKAFGISALGGFVGGTVGTSISHAQQKKESIVTDKVTERERRLIENYALLEDDYAQLERENVRLRRRATAYEAELSALRANNQDLKQDLEKARRKKRSYKKLVLEKRDELEHLESELKKFKPEGPATVPASSESML